MLCGTDADIIEVAGPSPDLSFRMRLLRSENPDVVNGLLALLPFQSFLLHVVVAGETIYTPAPSISLSSKNMVPRQKGTVYWNTTSQSVCFCYGAVTESTAVNQFAQVLDEDLPKLEALGRLVYRETVSAKTPTIVQMTMRLPGDNSAPKTQPHSVVGDKFDGSWQSAKALIEQEIRSLRQPQEPIDIKRIRLGATAARAGSEGSALQTIVFLQGFLSTLGPHVFSRLLAVSYYPEMTVPLMVRQTREFLIQTFNHFHFLSDLGLRRTAKLGDVYSQALDSVTTMDEYRELTDAMRTLIQLLYRWLHLVFPWHLKGRLQSRSVEEADGMPSLAVLDGVNP
ncbi:uncharacterized protein E0L32_006055 [Thyridium curvatum]|uniref:Cucumopine synthase C-terminal helical bundle domain-containing protein n=1 Tax=Thyridium curvatum TaxID=1093900 RepID=A0A507B4F3_9PEZI|nr:uncharacterized protein E0L32_006055 [Thyridium curvatum]TPX13584.1 hypothetical protein E0L32_006055 [Thyridium curvatum]